MNYQLANQVGRVVEIYRGINVPFEKLCKCSEAIESLKKQQELAKKSSFGEWAVSTIIADIPFTMLMYLAGIHPLILLPFMILTIVIIRKNCIILMSKGRTMMRELRSRNNKWLSIKEK